MDAPHIEFTGYAIPDNMTDDEIKRYENSRKILNKDVFDYSVTGIPKRYYGVSFETHSNSTTNQVRDFSIKGKGVLIIEGSNGSGKTETLCAAFYERYIHGLTPGLYLSCKYTVCPMMRSSRSFAAKLNEMDTYEKFYNIPFLVLDEVGKGDDTVLEKTFVSNVISARYDNDLNTAIGTNMTIEELCSWLGEDISSRFHQTAIQCVLDGKDWRKE